MLSKLTSSIKTSAQRLALRQAVPQRNYDNNPHDDDEYYFRGMLDNTDPSVNKKKAYNPYLTDTDEKEHNQIPQATEKPKYSYAPEKKLSATDTELSKKYNQKGLSRK
ncbi:MAG: hypothetical protein K0R98_1340 [Rickettsiaceae bacterium]|jgi:hypothetical protein|nr:hypothetical protein [Rickettsiaceae bacterium]